LGDSKFNLETNKAFTVSRKKNGRLQVLIQSCSNRRDRCGQNVSCATVLSRCFPDWPSVHYRRRFSHQNSWTQRWTHQTSNLGYW